jgi:hypothetical protein
VVTYKRKHHSPAVSVGDDSRRPGTERRPSATFKLSWLSARHRRPKLLAARPKDLEDVRELIGSRGTSLDHARIRKLLTLLERALGQSDLVPLYQRLRDEASRG